MKRESRATRLDCVVYTLTREEVLAAICRYHGVDLPEPRQAGAYSSSHETSGIEAEIKLILNFRTPVPSNAETLDVSPEQQASEQLRFGKYHAMQQLLTELSISDNPMRDRANRILAGDFASRE